MEWGDYEEEKLEMDDSKAQARIEASFQTEANIWTMCKFCKHKRVGRFLDVVGKCPKCGAGGIE